MTEKKDGHNIWFIALAVSLATFMEVLDTSIANVALPHIAGSLSIGPSERTWVLTSYLVSNAIVIPISGWLSTVIGRKRFYMGSVALFTLSSVACGFAPNIETLLLFRVIQGIGGGGLAPSEQSILTDTFPPAKLGQAFALYGMAVVVAPGIGPALGGWITDNFSWRWVFFINAPVGLLSLILTYHLIKDPPHIKEQQKKATRGGLRVDYMGFIFTCLFFGALQIVLDKGQEDDWFGSNLVLTCAIMAAVGLVGLIVWETMVAKEPMVDLPLLAKGNMGSSFLLMGMMGFILQATTVLLPQFAQDVLKYDATNAGLTLLPGGLVLVLSMVFVGRIIAQVQAKYLAACGIFFVWASMVYTTNFNTEVSFNTLVWARCIMCVGLPMFFIPVNTIAYSNLPPGKSENASALINVMRNFGGSIGIAVAITMLTRRADFHQNWIAGTLTPTSYGYRLWQQNNQALPPSSGFSASGGTGGGLLGGQGSSHGAFEGVGGGVVPYTRSLRSLYDSVLGQASMLSYIDVFKIMEVILVVVFVLILLTRKTKPAAASAPG